MVKLCDDLAKDKGSWTHNSMKPRGLNAWLKVSSQSKNTYYEEVQVRRMI